MSVKSLTVAAALVLGVGCDDPEVQGKVADLMEHGVSQAELVCDVSWTPPGSTYLNNSFNKFSYSAVKLIDGSCFTKFCAYTLNQPYQVGGNQYCTSNFAPRSSGGDSCVAVIAHDQFASTSTYPFRAFKDGVFAKVEDGEMIVGLEDNNLSVTQNCGSSQYPSYCSGPQVYFTYDITQSECTGRNLEAFGVE